MENVGGLGKQCIALCPYLVSGTTSLAPQRQHGPDSFPDAPWPINLSFFNLLFLFHELCISNFFLEFFYLFFLRPGLCSLFDGGRGVLAAGDGADLVLARLQLGHLVGCLLMRAVADAALSLSELEKGGK